MKSMSRLFQRLRGVREFVGPLWWYSGGLFLASQLGNVISMYTGVVLLPAKLSPADLGSVEPVTRLAALGAIPLTVIGRVGVKYLSTYHARNELGKIRAFLRDMVVVSVLASLVFSIVLVLVYDSVRVRLSLEGGYVLTGLVALMVISCWQPLVDVMAQGLQRFKISLLNSIAYPLAFLILVVLLVPGLRLAGLLGAKFFAGLVPILIGIYGLRSYIGRGRRGVAYHDEWRQILSFAWPVAVLVSTGWLQGFIEPFVVKHRLPAIDAAGFYMACKFGYIPMYFVTSINFVLFPMLSHTHEKGEPTRSLFMHAIIGTIAIGTVGIVCMALTSRWVFALFEPWHPFLPYSGFVWQIGVVVVIQSAIAILATNEMARRRFQFLWIYVPVIVFEITLLYGSLGWGFFRPYLPNGLWLAVKDLIPNSLQYVIVVMIVARVLACVLLVTYIFRSGQRKCCESGSPL